MPHLILPPRYTEDSILLWRGALACGWAVTRLQGWRIDAGFSADEPIIYGEPLFVAAVAEELGLLAVEPPLDFLARLPQRFRLRDVTFGCGADISTRGFPGFLKPADDKCFPAAVYSGARDLDRFSIPPEAPVIWSEPVQWEMEFRCFIAGRCEAMSIYARGGRLAQADDESWPVTPDEYHQAYDFVTELLSSPALDFPPALVIDIGRIAGRGWAVVEANPCWGSGVYGCSAEAVLRTLRSAFASRQNAPADIARWQVARRTV